MRHLLYALLLAVVAFAVASPLLAIDEPVPNRTIGNDRYQILESKALYIYTLNTIVRKGALERTWFFSVGPNGNVQPLTVLNLKNAFPDNHGFHDLLDMAFKHDSDLTKYDDFHKMFKVNRLLAASNER
jgi:hypothetical protein